LEVRKALGVDRVNEGTSALFSRLAPITVQNEKANAKRGPALKSPERAAKIAASKRDKRRTPETIEKMRQANLGKKASDEARANMSAARRQRGSSARGEGPAVDRCGRCIARHNA
jgi:hypothetical protein